MIVENGSNPHKLATTTDEQYQSASVSKQNKTYVDINSKMMHNSRNTNIDILIENYLMRDLANSRQK